MPLKTSLRQSTHATSATLFRTWPRLLLIAGSLTILAGCEPNTRPQSPSSVPKATPLVINLDLTTSQQSTAATPTIEENVAVAVEVEAKAETIALAPVIAEPVQLDDPAEDSVDASESETGNTLTTVIAEPAANITQVARQTQLLQLANSMLAKDYIDLSLSLLEEIDMAMLPTEHLGSYLESMAENHLRIGDSFTALAWLHKATALAPAIDQASKQKRLTLLHRAYRHNEQFMEAALTAIELANIQQGTNVGPEQQLASNDLIWEMLMQAPHMQLQARLQSPLHPTTKAWLELASSTDGLITLEQQQQAIMNWQLSNPLHPASLRLPSVLSNLSDLQARQAQKLALVLPTSGPLGKLGQAVIDGFMANYYQAMAACLQPCGQVPHLVFVNSHEVSDWGALLATLEEQEVDLIIGPLAKAKVDALNALKPRTIRSLALNYLSSEKAQGQPVDADAIDLQLMEELEAIAEQASPASGLAEANEQAQETLFQFGLSLEDEASQLATQGINKGLKQALIIQADTGWAQRTSATFQQQWQELGGKVTGQITFTGNGDHADSISQVLHIDGSNDRRRAMQNLLGDKLKFEPRRRQDVDLVVLLGLPKDARQLMPTLAFHHAANVTVFSTHHAYQGPTETTRDRDLNKMYFSDIPWMLAPDDVTRQVQKTWPNRQRFNRLFALGADAYRLYPRLEQMQIFNATRVQGSTGLLKLEDDNRIAANLTWARFVNGQPQVRRGAHELQ